MPDTIEDHEQALVRRAATDPDAFQTLYHHYFRRIYAYAAARIGNPHDAEDVVSEIFLRVIRNIDQLRNPRHTSFAAWLFVIARNTVADHYRHNGRSENLVPLDAVEPLVAQEPDPDHRLAANEEATQIQRMILALPERKREIIVLRYYGGLRNQEIAVVLGIGEKTVSAYLSRALNDLQAQYAALQVQYSQRSTDDE